MSQSAHCPSRHVFVGSLVLALAIFAGCDEDTAQIIGGKPNDTAGSSGDTGPSSGDVAATPCQSSKECAAAAQVCDKSGGKCVDCNLTSDCDGADTRCIKHRCEKVTSCKSDKQCLDLDAVCDKTSGLCVDCLAQADCPGIQECKAHQCVPPARRCDSSKDCKDLGRVCSQAGRCVDCVSDNDCEEVEHCSEGICIPDVCAAGETKCADSGEVRTCEANGSGWKDKACDGGGECHEGKCDGGVCTAGKGKCEGGKALTCKADGSGWGAVACGVEQTCVVEGDNAACKAVVCEAGKAFCEGQIAVNCSADGTAKTAVEDCSKPGKDGEAQQCVAGQCASASCVPSEGKCLDDATAAVCKLSGNGWETAPCMGAKPVCVAGKCVKCKPGQLYCGAAGKDGPSTVVMKCNSSGTDGDIVTMCEAGKVCENAGCMPAKACTAGQTKCGGVEKVLTCKADGTGWSEQPCGTGKGCKAGQCITGLVCVADEVFCKGDLLELCDMDGAGSQTMVDCAKTGKVCKGASCVDKPCTPGETKCVGQKLATCNPGGETWTESSCGPTLVCTSGKCGQAPICEQTFVSPDVPAPILDNNPAGMAIELELPDIAGVKKLTTTVELTNSATDKLELILYSPLNEKYELYSKGKVGQSLSGTWPDPDPLIGGDMSAWSSKSPKGKWRLHVIDSGFKNNGKDGAITKWSFTVKSTTCPSAG